ncbi:MAG TPA: hypothetical protein VFQ14_06550 [Thermoleophilaceae bacterium]|nr:hypothetical protein [Thermoleophilaceae bacterium]
MDNAQQQAVLDQTVSALRQQGQEAEARALEQVVPAPTQGAADKLWMVLVAGLVGLLTIAIVGLIYAVVDDKPTDVLVTVFTGLVTGLLGLFAKSPVGNTATG